jgi:hypothetical protein
MDEASRALIRSYEQFLDGEGTRDAVVAMCQRVWAEGESGNVLLSGTHVFSWSPTPYGVASQSQSLVWMTACHVHRERIAELERSATEDERFAWGFFGYEFPEFGATAEEVYRPLRDLLREVDGPAPYRSVTADPSWLTSAVVSLAEGIYADRAFDRLPILADALQDAGCDNSDVLEHCRGPGPHVRGYWVVDLVLGKS